MEISINESLIIEWSWKRWQKETAHYEQFLFYHNVLNRRLLQICWNTYACVKELNNVQFIWDHIMVYMCNDYNYNTQLGYPSI